MSREWSPGLRLHLGVEEMNRWPLDQVPILEESADQWPLMDGSWKSDTVSQWRKSWNDWAICATFGEMGSISSTVSSHRETGSVGFQHPLNLYQTALNPSTEPRGQCNKCTVQCESLYQLQQKGGNLQDGRKGIGSIGSIGTVGVTVDRLVLAKSLQICWLLFCCIWSIVCN